MSGHVGKRHMREGLRKAPSSIETGFEGPAIQGSDQGSAPAARLVVTSVCVSARS